MEYLAFALKYRPKDFSEVVGQAHVVTALKGAIMKGRVHHAYLFSGPRGVGKTSLARILAKSLNCDKGPTVTPCGECLSCQEIKKGKSLDIIEIDGASNRGIDEVRTLRENVKLSTAGGRYKVYIIDEVHSLTQDAFNALLKTLEEPPPHVKFIFATTHPHKVIPTILSRCQKFQFSLIPLESIVAKLKRIASDEKIKIKESLLYTIARAGEGSIRDAESLFDQVVPVILEKGSLDDVFSFLGVIDEESLNRMLTALIEKNLENALRLLERTVADGKDLGTFINALIEHARNLLLAKISDKNFKELSGVSPQAKDFMLELSKKAQSAEILAIIDLLIEAKSLAQRLNTVRIPFELALIKYIHRFPAVTEPDKKDKKKGPPKPEKEPERDLSEEIDALDMKGPAEESDVEAARQAAPAEKPADDTPGDNLLMQALSAKWKEAINYMQRKRAAIASHFSFAKPVSSRGSLVTIAFSPQDYFHKEVVENSKNMVFIEESFSSLMNKKVGVKFILQDLGRDSLTRAKKFLPQEGPPKSTEPLEAGKALPKTEEDDFLNDLLDTFGGKFHSEN